MNFGEYVERIRVLRMVSVQSNESTESFFNSFMAFKCALWPLESGIKKADKDFECCRLASKNKASGIQLTVHFDDIGRKIISPIALLKKKNANSLVVEEKKMGLQVIDSLKTGMAMFLQNLGNREEVVGPIELKREKKLWNANGDNDASCGNCLQFTVHLLATSFAETIPSAFETSKKRFRRQGDKVKQDSISNSKFFSHWLEQKYLKRESSTTVTNDNGFNPFEGFAHFMFDQLAFLQRFDQELQHEVDEKLNVFAQFDHLKAVSSFWEGQKAEVNGFLGNLRFARVGGVPPGIVGLPSSVKEDSEYYASKDNKKEVGASCSEQKIAIVPLSNMERLRSTIPVAELTELVPQLGFSSKKHPDKKKLFSVQDFFKYSESEGTITDSKDVYSF